jgi:hypothetical protein
MYCTLREGEREREIQRGGGGGGGMRAALLPGLGKVSGPISEKNSAKTGKNLHFIFAIFWVVCVNNFVQPLLSYFAEFSASWHTLEGRGW